MKRSTLVLLLIGAVFLEFTLARLAMFTLHRDLFASLTGRRLFDAFLQGVRFDASVLLILAAPLSLPLFIPVKKRCWHLVWGSAVYFSALVFCLFLVGDNVYFSFAKRHAAGEFFMTLKETPFVISVLKSYKWSFAAFLTAGVFGYILLFVALKKLRFKEEGRLALTLKAALFILLAIIGIRGGLGTKPIAAIDAYSGGGDSGNLILNGVFTIYRSYGKRFDTVAYMETGEALKILGLKGSRPFLKTAPPKAKRNVVLLIMESWSAYYMGALGAEFGVTPNFDRLAREGMLFKRHYAAEKRSIDGIQALLTGIPPLRSIPSMGFGLEVKVRGNLGALANQNGFESVFVQTSLRKSFHMDAIAKTLGFTHYYGMEDIGAPILKYPKFSASVYGWDYEGLMFLKSMLDKLYKKEEKPFLAIFFSGTTHTPYPPLPQEFYKFKEGVGNDENSFLNTLYYADYSLGSFIEEARRTPWFKNTVFIITADHVHGKFEKGSFPEDFHVPLLVYAPELIERGEEERVTSHLDILSTVIEQAGIGGEYSTAGLSVFNKDEGRRAFVSSGVGGLIKDDNLWVFGNEESSAAAAPLQTELHALEQAVTDTINNGAW